MKKIIFFLLSFLPFAGAQASPLEIGAEAPNVQAIDQDGRTISLGDLYDKGRVLVFFYPKASTPGCTAQACSLRDEFAVLKEQGVEVLGVSTDSVAAQKKFQEKYNLPFSLIADQDATVVKAFGVPTRGNFASRQAFLIEGGKIVWRDLSASTAKQAQDVVAALEALK
jgi:thioredoxin-dependent peroxiredoxin